MEEARQIVRRLSDGLIDVVFEHKELPITKKNLFTFDEQYQFMKDHPSRNKFVFIGYTSENTPNYDYMSTCEVPYANNIVTVCEGNQSAFNSAYEMFHAVQMYLQQLKISQTVNDVFTPSEEFILKEKWPQIKPYIPLIACV
jgi:hypothetical protein